MGRRAVMKVLREETAVLHDEIEAVAFHRQLSRGRIDETQYMTLLDSLKRIHEVQESLRDMYREERVGSLAGGLHRWCKSLEADLKDGQRRGAQSAGVVAGAESYVQALVDRVGEEPLGLVGHLYVLHGSLLGGMQLRPLVLEALGWSPDEVRYFGGLGRQVPMAWKAFKEAVNGAGLNEQQRQLLVREANEAFRRLTVVYEDLGEIGAVPKVRRGGARW